MFCVNGSSDERSFTREAFRETTRLPMTSTGWLRSLGVPAVTSYHEIITARLGGTLISLKVEAVGFYPTFALR